MKALRVAPATALVLLFSSCASAPAPAPPEIYAGQVQYVATPDEARHGFYYFPKANETIYGVVPSSEDVPPATALIDSCGYEGNPDTRFALVRFYYYWLDVSRQVKSFARWTMVDNGLPVQRGNLVEVNVHFKSAKSICAVVTKVRAVGLDEAECEYHDNKRSTTVTALAKFSPAGGPGTASLYCPFLVTEGWKKSPIGPYGGGGFGGFAWSKTSP